MRFSALKCMTLMLLFPLPHFFLLLLILLLPLSPLLLLPSSSFLSPASLPSSVSSHFLLSSHLLLIFHRTAISPFYSIHLTQSIFCSICLYFFSLKCHKICLTPALLGITQDDQHTFFQSLLIYSVPKMIFPLDPVFLHLFEKDADEVLPH